MGSETRQLTAERLVLLTDVAEQLAATHSVGIAEPVPPSLLCAAQGCRVGGWDEFSVQCGAGGWFGATIERYPDAVASGAPEANRALALRLIVALQRASVEDMQLLRLLLPCCRRTWNRALEVFRGFVAANGGPDAVNTHTGPSQRALADALLAHAVAVAWHTWDVCERVLA